MESKAEQPQSAQPQSTQPERGQPDQTYHDIVVIGASAGGIEALRTLLGELPPDLPASIFVVVHLSPQSPGVLPEILSRAGPLPAHLALDNAPFEHGHVYTAPPDRHLLLENEHMRLTTGPKENRARPAVDPLFRSAAYAYGPRVIGIILSGSLDDGTAGLWAVKDRGGIAIVQDPRDAMYRSMPQNALRYVRADYRLSAAEIGKLLPELVCQPCTEQGGSPVPESMKIETRIALQDDALEAGVQKLGPLSPFTCPECHGVLIQMKEGTNVRFRCHTGHAYSIESLLEGVNQSIDDTLWTAVRTLEERLMLLQHLEQHAQEIHNHDYAQLLDRQALATQDRVQILRQLVLNKQDQRGQPPTEIPPTGMP